MTQKYIPTKWVANETIGTANVMNNIEQGIVGAYDEIERVTSQLEQKVNKDDIYININEYKNLVENGIWTNAIQTAINECMSTGKTLFFPVGKYVIDDTIEININPTGASGLYKGFSILGENPSTTIFLSRCTNKPVFRFTHIANSSFLNAVFVEKISIRPDTGFKYLGDGIELVNSMGNIYKDIHIEHMNNGIYLTTDSNTNINVANNGFTEQNVFENCYIGNCNNCVTFEPGQNDIWNTSFHGTVFDNTMLLVNNSQSNIDRVCCINILGGLIYNCVFNVRTYLVGDNAHLLHINGDSEENYGNISYEHIKGNGAKISTGDNVRAKFMLDGNIVGYGELDWSEYKPSTLGELDYNKPSKIYGEHKTISTKENFNHFGREKFYCNNLIPPVSVNNNQGDILNISKTPVNTEKSWRMSDIVKYQSTTKADGHMVISRQGTSSVNSGGFILATVEEAKTDKIKPNLEIAMDGSYIKSLSNNCNLQLTSNAITRNNKKIYDTGTVSTTLGTYGWIKQPTGAYERWDCVATSKTGFQTFNVNIGGFAEIYQVLVTYQPYSTPSSADGITSLVVSSVTSSSFKISGDIKTTGLIFYRVYGKASSY